MKILFASKSYKPFPCRLFGFFEEKKSRRNKKVLGMYGRIGGLKQ
jgi:hypothetical protein